MSALEKKARAFASAYPKRPPSRTSGTWAECCGILQVMFGGYLGGATTAQIANNALPWWRIQPKGDISSAAIVRAGSAPFNTNAAQAPIGAWHFWDIGKYGHVGLDLNGAGAMVFMASTFCSWDWGDDIGAASVSGYTKASGAVYRGWSMNYSKGYTYLPAESGGGGAGGGKKNVATIYKKSTRTFYALAGDSPGTEANWIETTDQTIANAWAVAHGNAVILSDASFDSFKERYLTPLRIINQSATTLDVKGTSEVVLPDAMEVEVTNWPEPPEVLPVEVTNWPDDDGPGPGPGPDPGDGGTFRITVTEPFNAVLEPVETSRRSRVEEDSEPFPGSVL